MLVSKKKQILYITLLSYYISYFFGVCVYMPQKCLISDFSHNMLLKANMSVADAITAIKGAKRCVIFSGAGMSKESGIDTFRGAAGSGGFWSGILGSAALVYGGTPLG